MRITDAEDDYTVTADQRAALMELETLTWNYPTPQQGRGRGTNIPATSFPPDDQTDTDDDDDDDSYYVDMMPYDMTNRLKEVNRAFIEDPTPAECNRAITIRFREVIADYQSPREYYPSDSDDGYGDSSDIIYDAEDDESGLTSLTSEVRDILADNVNVIDFLPQSAQDNGFGDYSNLTNNYNGLSDDPIIKDYENIGMQISQEIIENDKVSQVERKADVPKLQLNGNQEDSTLTPSVDDFLSPSLNSISGSQGAGEINLLKVDDSGLADLESFMKDIEAEEIEVELSRDDNAPVEKGLPPPVGSVSLIESSDQIYVGKGFNSLDNVGSGDLMVKEIHDESESGSNVFFQRKEPKDTSSSSNQQIPAKSETDFATFDYTDDFEEFEEEEVSKAIIKEVEKQVPSTPPAAAVPHVQNDAESDKTSESNSPSRSNKVTEKKNKQSTRKESPVKTGHKSKRDQSPKQSPSPSTERRKRPESKTSSVETTETSVRTKSKRVASGPPTIKPALLSSDKLNHMKTNDTSRYKSRNSTSSSRPANGSVTPSSSPSLSASSSSSTSSSTSYSSSGSLRGRSRTPISGPVRPTQHKSSSNGRVSSRGANNSPVRTVSSPVHQGLALSPTPPTPPASSASGRPSPPYRVRKAASASDLHSSSRVSEDSDDRMTQSEAVFRAWLQQKDKQAALAKKQQRKTSGGRCNPEVTERRARAEEAFQAWLARKRDQLRLEKKMRGERRRLEDQNRYARTKAECEVAYKEWCRRKRDEVRTVRPNGVVPRSQSLERPWVQEKTRKLYNAYLNGH